MIPIWALALACTQDVEPPATTRTTPSTPTGTTPTGTEPTGTTSPEGDVAVVLDLVAGTGDPTEVAQAIAWSGGWPVRDGAGTAWFVHVDAGGPWAVAGDFSGWEPVAMTDGGGFWWAEVEVGDDVAGLRYKLVGPGDSWIADPIARSYTYDDYGEMSYVAPPTDTWRLDRWPGASSAGVVARDLRVYVPPGPGPFPVLYAHDGQNLFDPHALWGGWRLQDALAARPVLVVGIDNTFDRFEEYTHVPDDVGLGGVMGGNGDAYAALVHDVVRPHVEAVYGTDGRRGVMGSSLGGLISLHVGWSYPGEYDFVASLSGTLGWGRFTLDEETMEERWLADRPASAVYLDSGGDTGPDGSCRDLDGDGYPEDDPDSSDNYCETRQMADALAGAGWTWDQDLWHWHEPGAAHNEAEWAARVDRPLDLFLSL